VNWYSEVFDLLFPGLDQEAARTVWQKALAKPKDSQKDSQGDEE
jgi:Lon-like ATP-dependent protease